MNQYENFLEHILKYGVEKSDRTGTGTKSVFGYQMRFDLNQGFPLITTKKVHFKSIVTELLWFLRGDTNTGYLRDNGCTIWDEWADSKGNLGPVYGKQWRDWATPHGSIDQITQVLNQLINDPDSRRIIVSAWNVGELDQMALMPCHAFFQFYTREMTTEERVLYTFTKNFDPPSGNVEDFLDKWNVPKRTLSCQLYQRSADAFLGVPFNIASYALLVHMLAAQVNMVPGDLIWTGGDCHIYSNHYEQVKEQLTRVPYFFPDMTIKSKPDLFSYTYDDIVLSNYHHHPAIKAPVAI